MNEPKAPLWWTVAGLIAMAVLTTIQDAFTDQHINAQEWVMVVFQAAMAVNVYLTANLPGYQHAKRYVAAVLAMLIALHTFVIGGVDTPEIINLVIVGLSTMGVVFSPQPLTRTVDGQVRVYRSSDGPPRMTTR